MDDAQQKLTLATVWFHPLSTYLKYCSLIGVRIRPPYVALGHVKVVLHMSAITVGRPTVL